MCAVSQIPEPRRVVPAIRDRDHARDWLYERAEEACGVGMPLDVALQAVRDGYSSRVADYVFKYDLDEWPDDLIDLSKVDDR